MNIQDCCVSINGFVSEYSDIKPLINYYIKAGSVWLSYIGLRHHTTFKFSLNFINIADSVPDSQPTTERILNIIKPKSPSPIKYNSNYRFCSLHFSIQYKPPFKKKTLYR